jgi:hypothetical protein
MVTSLTTTANTESRRQFMRDGYTQVYRGMQWDVLPTACAPRVRVFDQGGRVLFSVPCRENTEVKAAEVIDGFLDRNEIPTENQP